MSNWRKSYVDNLAASWLRQALLDGNESEVGVSKLNKSALPAPDPKPVIHEDEREREVAEDQIHSQKCGCDKCEEKYAKPDPNEEKAHPLCRVTYSAWRTTPAPTVSGEHPLEAMRRMYEKLSKPDDETWVATEDESLFVCGRKMEERRAIVLGEARAQISIRRTWPACPTDHLSLNVAEVSKMGGGVGCFVVLRCPKGCNEQHIPLALSPKALRALEAAGGAVRA